MRNSRNWIAALPLAVLLAATGPTSSTAAAQDAPSLSGHWTIDRTKSEFPSEIGFDAAFVEDASAAAAAANSGRGGGRSRQPAPRAPLKPESQDDASRVQQLTAEVRAPSVNLLVVDTPAAVTITDDKERSRTFRPTGKEETIQLDRAPVAETTTRAAGRLVVLYKVEDGHDLRYTYSASADPPQLVVEATFMERGVARETVRRVYVPGTTAPPPPAAAGTSTQAAPPAGGSSPPTGLPPAAGSPPAQAPAKGPDAELRGLKRLGLIVEDLSDQAGACGLTHDAIDAAATKSLTDAGLAVLRTVSSNDNTYVYITVVTTRVNADLCVSKYDAFLYTHTTTKLSYGDAPVSIQVSLLHNGGLAGGSAAAHSASVMRGLKEYVDQFASRIRDANK